MNRARSFRRMLGVLAGTSLLAGAASAGLAQVQDFPPNVNRPLMSVTAGQGGYVFLPEVRPAPFALTGARSSSTSWERQLGPRFNAGQTIIFLPAARQ